MAETLIDFFKDIKGYSVKENYLLRPDSSIAAELKDGKWVSNPREYEIAEFTAYCGRGFPSMLCLEDLTNRGHTKIRRAGFILP